MPVPTLRHLKSCMCDCLQGEERTKLETLLAPLNDTATIHELFLRRQQRGFRAIIQDLHHRVYIAAPVGMARLSKGFHRLRSALYAAFGNDRTELKELPPAREVVGKKELLDLCFEAGFDPSPFLSTKHGHARTKEAAGGLRRPREKKKKKVDEGDLDYEPAKPAQSKTKSKKKTKAKESTKTKTKIVRMKSLPLPPAPELPKATPVPVVPAPPLPPPGLHIAYAWTFFPPPGLDLQPRREGAKSVVLKPPRIRYDMSIASMLQPNF